jgi:signal transduction histidine kinase
MPHEGRSQTVLDEGIGMIVDSFSQAFTLRVSQLRQFDSALYAPMRAAGRGIGVMMLLRTAGGTSFESDDLAMAEAFAAQAAIVLVLAEARHADDVKTLLTERERIARDLHDLAIQQLFATGMRLDNARREVASGVDPIRLDHVLTVSLDNVDDSIRQIRSIIHDLRDPDADVSLTERLRREASLARAGLGFAPSMIILVDGQVVDGSELDLEYDLDRLIVQDLADDVVAVAREGLANAARHAKASSVTVTVSISREDRSDSGTGSIDHRSITVSVADDGIGLTDDSGRRSGLKNLSARARRHKGKLAVHSKGTTPGTTIVWTVPLVK